MPEAFVDGPIPDWMVIDAVRYAIGRRSYQVGTTCEWVRANWERLPENVREIIQRDVEEAFACERRARDVGSDFNYLGADCDRREWEQVRALWEGLRKGGAL